MPRITVKKIYVLGSYVVYPSEKSARRRLKSLNFTSNALANHEKYSIDSSENINLIVSKVKAGRTYDEVFHSLLQDQACNTIPISHNLVSQLLYRFKDDWKSALGVFKWAESHETYTPSSDSYETMLDILGKTKQMEKMMSLLEQMNQRHLVTIGSIAKVMRRLCGAGKWEDAVIIFDELCKFGLEKNTESMNLLLDTLCKESKVEQARKIFLELKSCIAPSAYTFNIFVHGWCKVNRVIEAHWTIQEMKGYGYNPSVISYSTIIESYCRNSNFNKAYEMLDEMQAQNCPPNVVTFTTIMCYLKKNEEYYEALQIPEKMKLFGCKPDTLFYNALIHTLAKAGRVREAVDVFEVEMPSSGIFPDTSTFNSMITMFCHHGMDQEALNVLKKMESSQLCRPDIQSFSPLLKMCFRKGKTDVLLGNLLDEMVNKHHISFDLATYTLLIHGLCRANKCDWAYGFFKEMIDKDIAPRYYTCALLVDELKQKYNYVAADHIEGYMKQMKSS
ncbi:putative tetratricopeptide-like helical domain superfamily [Helianthus annuus]|uniref:Tetratricopeptide-like helical domain superfamily n=2 Tax=Helianthus annuus TaxID=4232 RepID=A0A9K3IBI7_HELAN|nr:pentatricopeptide repeat-containing protein At3g04130, mitochondrial [Helianthus annuus]KAF5793662.1 putative tetratricopeptide-like helical domain superfamily [Helianthus annuus]KAJ0537412.1 putative tetratricopeptide-like helical domain superfamily [Helianthus annuus]KAJ0537415.1 putative tetratricopeptide-like helical domain superfamily [Helianthus annuus]KAJ0544934.1 putative tetratricopeptide-like helical domain superfamily [Helianthus annuus]KAJ0551992.1 putative tetratricopeptide-lik